MKISVEQEKKGDKVDKLDDTNKSSTKAIPVEEIKSDESSQTQQDHQKSEETTKTPEVKPEPTPESHDKTISKPTETKQETIVIDQPKSNTNQRKNRKKINLKKPNIKKPNLKKPNLKKTNLASIKNKAHNIKKENKQLIIICAVAVVAIIAVVVVSLIKNQPIDSSFFESNENQDVITLEVTGDNATTTNLVRTHIVYTYNGDKISSLKTYYEYSSYEDASQAFDNTKTINSSAESVYLDNNFIIVTAKPDQYESLSPSDVKQQADAIRRFQNQQKDSKESKDSKDDKKAEK